MLFLNTKVKFEVTIYIAESFFKIGTKALKQTENKIIFQHSNWICEGYPNQLEQRGMTFIVVLTVP